MPTTYDWSIARPDGSTISCRVEVDSDTHRYFVVLKRDADVISRREWETEEQVERDVFEARLIYEPGAFPVDARSIFYFQRAAISTERWAAHAWTLRRSAEILWKQIESAFETLAADERDEAGFERLDHSYAYLLVAGAALEAMIKAAAIQLALNRDGRDAIFCNGGAELIGWVTRHDLTDLSKRAKVEGLSPSDEEWLQRFQRYVVWAGSYPTDKRMSKTDKPLDFGVTNLEQRNFEKLFDCAERAYQAARSGRGK